MLMTYLNILFFVGTVIYLNIRSRISWMAFILSVYIAIPFFLYILLCYTFQHKKQSLIQLVDALAVRSSKWSLFEMITAQALCFCFYQFVINLF